MDFDASAPPYTCEINCIQRSSENSRSLHVVGMSVAALWFHNHMLVCACMHFRARTQSQFENRRAAFIDNLCFVKNSFLIISESVLVSTSSNVCLPYEFLIPTLLHPLLRVQHVKMVHLMLTCRSSTLAFFFAFFSVIGLKCFIQRRCARKSSQLKTVAKIQIIVKQ
jgi:hypothetical protein